MVTKQVPINTNLSLHTFCRRHLGVEFGSFALKKTSESKEKSASRLEVINQKFGHRDGGPRGSSSKPDPEMEGSVSEGKLTMHGSAEFGKASREDCTNLGHSEEDVKTMKQDFAFVKDRRSSYIELGHRDTSTATLTTTPRHKGEGVRCGEVRMDGMEGVKGRRCEEMGMTFLQRACGVGCGGVGCKGGGGHGDMYWVRGGSAKKLERHDAVIVLL